MNSRLLDTYIPLLLLSLSCDLISRCTCPPKVVAMVMDVMMIVVVIVLITRIIIMVVGRGGVPDNGRGGWL